MLKTSHIATLLIAATLGACSGSPPPPPPAPAATASDAAEPDPPWVGKVWISTKLGAPRGSMMIFLPDRSLLMDSCFETYRLTKWGGNSQRIRWLEDTVPIEAEVSMPSPGQLRLHLAGQDDDQNFIAASVPYTCPDMPK